MLMVGNMVLTKINMQISVEGTAACSKRGRVYADRMLTSVNSADWRAQDYAQGFRWGGR